MEKRSITRGSLLGAACGDAIGAPFDGAPVVDPMMVEVWIGSSRPLRHTDDTAMSLVLARHLAANEGAVDQDRLVRMFSEEWSAHPDRGYGAAPPRIFQAVLDGEDWSELVGVAFGGSGSWGNGGAMRVAAVAHLPAPLDDRARMARDQAAVTHAHPLAQEGAAVQCMAVAAAADSAGRELDIEHILTTIDQQATTPEFHDALEDVTEAVMSDWPVHQITARMGADVSALGSVPTAVALALSNLDDLRAALVSAVQAGGDTDTIASMVGAIVGARVGEQGIPPEMTARLEISDDLVQAADALATLAAR